MLSLETVRFHQALYLIHLSPCSASPRKRKCRIKANIDLPTSGQFFFFIASETVLRAILGDMDKENCPEMD